MSLRSRLRWRRVSFVCNDLLRANAAESPHRLPRRRRRRRREGGGEGGREGGGREGRDVPEMSSEIRLFLVPRASKRGTSAAPI